MSEQITTAMVKGYSALIERLLQQEGSQFLGKTRQEDQASEEEFFEQIGAVEAEEVSIRFADSPQMDTPHARRRVTLRPFQVGDFFDSFDKVKTLIDPTSTYVQNFVDALQRKRDTVIKDAFFGTAYTGKAGTTQVTFPAANQIAVTFGGTASGLTIAKLIEARRLLISYQNVPGREPWYVAITARQLADLLNTTQVTSADYNSVKALVDGTVNSFLGFEFVQYQSLDTAAGDQRVPAWVKSGILHTVGMSIENHIDRRADKSFNWYAMSKAMFGATRMQENKVIEIVCDLA